MPKAKKGRTLSQAPEPERYAFDGGKQRAIGIVELNSISKGVETVDAMLKAADVKMLVASPTCPGKYIIIVGGEVAPCRAAVDAGISVAKNYLTDHNLIPNVHEQVFPAIQCATEVENFRAIGVLETFGLPSCIVAADAAVKAADITLIEIRLARALGGKAFVIFTGEVAAVRAAVKAGSKEVQDTGLLLGSVVIPHPHPDILRAIV